MSYTKKEIFAELCEAIARAGIMEVYEAKREDKYSHHTDRIGKYVGDETGLVAIIKYLPLENEECLDDVIEEAIEKNF